MIIVTCADCCADLDITEARGPDGFGDWHCLDVEACDARLLALIERLVEDHYGV